MASPSLGKRVPYLILGDRAKVSWRCNLARNGRSHDVDLLAYLALGAHPVSDLEQSEGSVECGVSTLAHERVRGLTESGTISMMQTRGSSLPPL